MVHSGYPVLFIVIIFVLGDLTSGQKLPKPNLPPPRGGQKQQLQSQPQPLFPGPPLLPAVPSPEFVERLTKAQLAFIRHHQSLQAADQTAYTPYACLPKYICIIQNEDGTKRTAVVNGLHPALRELPGANKMNEPYLPGKGSSGSKNSQHGRSDLDDEDPKQAFQNQQRLAHDDFLRDQELAEQAAIEAEFQRREKLSKSKPTDSGEDSESEQESREFENTPTPGQSSKIQQQEPDTSFHGDPNPVAAVPWDDRPKVKVNLTRSSGLGLLGKFRAALPIPKLFRRQRTPAPSPPPKSPPKSNPNKSMIRRMLQFRGKREARAEIAAPFLTQLGPGIKSSDQCRVLYNGCDLDYDQIMQIAEEGQVLIEGDDPAATPKPANIYKLKLRPEDDEIEQAAKLYAFQKKKKTSGYKINPKNKGPAPPLPIGNPSPSSSNHGNAESEEGSEEGEGPPVRRTPYVPSLPIRPMKFNWGRPLVWVNGRPQSPELFGLDPKHTSTVPPPPPPSTTPPPVFVSAPLYPKINRTVTETNLVPINATHALEIKTPKTKPYRPHRATLSDKNGNPASFASVFTEIAGSSGGIHDYFDKIAQSVGGPPLKRGRTTKEIPPPPPSALAASKKKKNARNSEEDEEASDEEEEEEEDEPVPQKPEPEAEESDEEEEDVHDDRPEVDEDVEEDDDQQYDLVEDSSSGEIKPKRKEKPYSTSGKVKNRRKKTKKMKKKVISSKEVDDEAEDDLVVVDPAELEALVEDEPEDDLDVTSTSSKKNKTKKKSKKKSNKKKVNAKNKVKDKTKEKVKEEEEEYDSEEVRKRNKAANEVQLPEFLSEEVKHAIREGIRNGHKEDHGKPKEPKEGEEQEQGEEEGGGPSSDEPAAQPPGYYGHYGDPAQYSRPQQYRPKRPGLLSLFG